MSGTISLAIAIHNHQPVGNFDFVFEENFNKAYLPFLEVLERHPGVKISLHQSGSLLEWLINYKPDYCRRVKTLVDTGQVEILGGGYYEPILPIIPDEDKIGQILAYRDYLKDVFGAAPRGVWLAERVWEPHLPKPLADALVEFLLVDENHFIEAGLATPDLYGYYVTEELGRVVRLFPILKTLRHAIPFKPPGEVIKYLRQEAVSKGAKLAVFGDDGEKFGGWPDTYKSVYEEGWLEQFFSLLERNASWLKLESFGKYIDQHSPLGRIYLPVASYNEMEEWALPVKTQHKYGEVLETAKQNSQANWPNFVRGGIWRNFFMKYPESNRLHKTMLRVSKKVWKMPDGQARTTALRELWQGECNCAYWHGIFGGLYLPHLRLALYQHLINAETLAETERRKTKSWVSASSADYDGDGKNEILLESDIYSIMLKPDTGGHIIEWSNRPGKVNLLATMTRREEAYHKKIRSLAESALKEQNSGNIHELVRVKEKGIDQYLQYDWYERVSLIDHFLCSGAAQEEFSKSKYGEEGDFVNQPYQSEITKSTKGLGVVKLWRDGHVWDKGEFLPIRIEKDISVAAGSDKVQILYKLSNSGKPINVCFGVEWNLAFLSDNHPTSNYQVGEEPQQLFSHSASYKDVKEVKIIDDLRKFKFSLCWDIASELWVEPLGVVSQSESGFERVFQQLMLISFWSFTLQRDAVWTLKMESSQIIFSSSFTGE